MVVLGLVACAHTPEGNAADPDAGTPVSDAAGDVLPGQLVVGTEAPGEEAGVLDALATDGYRFEYVAAASARSHLVRVTKADGTALSAAETTALKQQLAGRPGLAYVELNRVRQPR